MLLDTSFVVDLMREANARVEGPATIKLRKLGATRLRLPTMDLLVATVARAEGEPVLTGDKEHFSRVPGVTVESY